jgi:hypothetical protein
MRCLSGVRKGRVASFVVRCIVVGPFGLFGSTHLFRIREGNRWELGVGLDLPSQYSHNNRHNNRRNNRQLPVTVGSKVVR